VAPKEKTPDSIKPLPHAFTPFFTSIARFFAGVRGRALSIANLEFSLGEGNLPALMLELSMGIVVFCWVCFGKGIFLI